MRVLRIAPRGTLIAKNASGMMHFESHLIPVSAKLTSGIAISPPYPNRSSCPGSNQELKSIPASIGDLSQFFNIPESEQSLFSTRVMARVNTDPPPTRSSLERTQSIKDSAKERHVLKLYLMRNMITSLPPELFTVKNLTVLSLRMSSYFSRCSHASHLVYDLFKAVTSSISYPPISVI